MKSTIACTLGSIDLVRALGLGGIGSAVVAKPGVPVRASKFTKEVINWTDPLLEPDAMMRRLVSFAGAQAEKPVLFYQNDNDLMFISENRARLGMFFTFVLADAELIETLVDKARFQMLAKTHDLPVPESRTFNARSDSISDLNLDFPFIIKPVMRGLEAEKLQDHAKALEVESSAKLERLWPELERMGFDFLAQRLIPGPESAIESYHAYIDESGEVVAGFTGRKIRTLPPRYGHSTALETTSAADVEDLGRDIAGRIGLTGIAKFDFKRAPDGTLHLLEINPRFNLWHYLGAVAGVNLPALVHADLTGQPRGPTGPARAGVRYCNLSDRRAARAVGMPSLRWVRFMLSSEARMISLSDPMPTLNVLRRKLVGG